MPLIFKILAVVAFSILPVFSSFAALPFVTDDAGTANKNQLLLEAFSEGWHLPQKGENKSANLSGNYLGLSYGISNNLELAIGGLAGYDFSDNSAALSNPIFQAKTVVFEPSKKEIPTVALSFGYANRNGSGQYYDTANNSYALVIATSKFFDDRLVIHVNSGPKASFDLDTNKNLYRLQLGVAADFALLRDDVRGIVESFNGAPNSPRDSPGYFHSYQAGFRWLKSDITAFHILYGSQPTFAGYDGNQMLHRRSNWVQIGIRKAFNGIF